MENNIPKPHQPNMSEFATGRRLAGKVAIVTGAASGFGRAIAIRFASEGCQVVAGDVNEAGAAETVKNFSDNVQGAALRMDVTKEVDWKAAVQEAESRWNKLDIIVNNAGWSYKNKVSHVSSCILVAQEATLEQRRMLSF